MRAIKANDTRPERVLFAAVKRVLGPMRVIRCAPGLRGRPDLYIPEIRLALFCDGCFFHGCEQHCRIPHRNSRYWIGKVAGNVKRDRAVRKALRRMGLSVWRIWEHDCHPATSDRLVRRLLLIRSRLSGA
jgi:DNA mismatch endonuclease, patch repair protein